MFYEYDCGFSDWFALTVCGHGFVVFPRFSEPIKPPAVDPKFRLYGLWGRLRQGCYRPPKRVAIAVSEWQHGVHKCKAVSRIRDIGTISLVLRYRIGASLIEPLGSNGFRAASLSDARSNFPKRG